MKVLVEAHTHSQTKCAICYMWADTFFMRSFPLHHSIFLLNFSSAIHYPNQQHSIYLYCEMFTWKTVAIEYDMLIAVACHDGETSSWYNVREWKWISPAREICESVIQMCRIHRVIIYVNDSNTLMLRPNHQYLMSSWFAFRTDFAFLHFFALSRPQLSVLQKVKCTPQRQSSRNNVKMALLKIQSLYCFLF